MTLNEEEISQAAIYIRAKNTIDDLNRELKVARDEKTKECNAQKAIYEGFMQEAEDSIYCFSEDWQNQWREAKLKKSNEEDQIPPTYIYSEAKSATNISHSKDKTVEALKLITYELLDEKLQKMRKKDPTVTLLQAFFEVFKKVSKSVRQSTVTNIKLHFDDELPSGMKKREDPIEEAPLEVHNAVFNFYDANSRFVVTKDEKDESIEEQQNIIDEIETSIESILQNKEEKCAELKTTKPDKITTYTMVIDKRRKKGLRRGNVDNVKVKYNEKLCIELLDQTFNETFEKIEDEESGVPATWVRHLDEDNDEPICPDDIVEANYQGKGKWIRAKVTDVHQDDTYDLEYDSYDEDLILRNIEAYHDDFVEKITRMFQRCDKAHLDQLKAERQAKNDEIDNANPEDLLEEYVKFERNIETIGDVSVEEQKH